MDDLIAKNKLFIEIGGSKTESSYIADEKRIEQLRNIIKNATAEKEELLRTGEAYTGETIDNTGTEEYRAAVKEYEEAVAHLNKQTMKAQFAFSQLANKVQSFGGNVSGIMRLRIELDALKAVANNVKHPIETIKSSFTSFVASIKDRAAGIAATLINGVVHPFQNLKNIAVPALKKISSVAKSAAKTLGSALVSGLKKAATAMLGLNKNTKKSDRSIGSNLKTMLKYGLGIRSVFVLVNKLRRALVDGFKNLAQYDSKTNASISSLMSSLTQLKNSFATAFAPILNVVAPILKSFIDMISRAVTYVGMFIAALTGQSSFVKATAVQEDYAASLGDSADAAKKAEKAQKGYLSGLDEIKRWEDSDSDTDSGYKAPTPQDMFETVPIESNIKGIADVFADTIDKMKKKAKELAKIFKKGFFDGLGDYKTILKDMSSDFQSIQKSLKGIFTDPAVKSSINGFSTSVVKMLGSIVGSVARIGLTIAQNFIGGIEKYLSANSERIKTWITSIFDIKAKMAELIAQFSIDFADVFSVFGSDTAQQLTANVIGIFAETFMGITEFIEIFVLDIVERIVTAFSENKERIKESLAGTLEGLEAITSAIQDTVQFITETVLPDLNKGIQGLLDVLKPLTDFLIDAFFSVWNDMLNPVLQYLGKTLIPDIVEMFQHWWNDILVPLGKFIGSVLSPIIKLFAGVLQSLWKNVIVPLAQAIGSVLGKAWENLKEIMMKTVIPAWKNTIATMQYFWDKVGKPIANWFVNNFKPIIDKVFGGFKNAIEGLKKALGGILDFIGGVFTGNWKKAWQGIKDIFSGLWEGLISIVKNPINAIIGILNALIRGVADVANWIGEILNSLSFEIPDWVPGVGGRTIGFNFGTWTPGQIPYLATGAVIPPNAPFMAMLGDQRNGNNLEMPENLLRKIIREETGRQGTGNNTYKFIGQINRRTLFEEMMEEAQLVRGRTGHNPFEMA